MFIIWGFDKKRKIAGIVDKNFLCKHCHNVTPFQIIKTITWLELYIIPVIPIHSEYRAECPICSYGYDIEKKRAKEILETIKDIPDETSN